MYVIPSTWVAGATYNDNGVAGDYVKPTRGNATAFFYRCVVAGNSGSLEPTWPLSLGLAVVDGTAEWVCAGLAPLISQKDLEDRVSRQLVRAGLDDNNDGFSDAGPVNRILVDASSYVMGAIGGAYDFPIGSPYPNELQRIALDVACAYLSIRHPEMVRFDGQAMLLQARAELKDLKNGVTQLDIPLLGAAVSGNVVPPVAPTPTGFNIGGFVRDCSHRLVIDDASGRPRGGDF